MLGLVTDPASAPTTQWVGVTLLGGGPGDPELLTVAGLKALLAADVVVVDHLAPGELVHELAPDVEVVDVSKYPRGPATAQETINQLLIDRARQGRNVVRLKGGDVYVFGRGYEELLACQEAGVPVRVIPGLSSSIAVPALAGIPVTHRGVVHEFSVVSGHLPPDHPDGLTDWTAVAGLTGTVVLLMAVANAGAIATALMAHGRPPRCPVAVICDGSLPTERVVRTTLAELGDSIATERIEPPAVIVVGAVVDIAGTTSSEWSSRSRP